MPVKFAQRRSIDWAILKLMKEFRVERKLSYVMFVAKHSLVEFM